MQSEIERTAEAREVADLWFKGLGLRAIAERKGMSRELAALRLKQAGVSLVAVNTLPVGSTIAIIDESDGRIFARGVVTGRVGRWAKHVVLDINEYRPVSPTRITGATVIAIVRGAKGKLGAIQEKP